MSEGSGLSERLLTYLRAAGLAAGLFGSIVFFPWWIIVLLEEKDFRAGVLQNLPMFLGVPAAVMTAFCIVLLFRTVEGQIKFTVLGVTVEGASGPIIMWGLCFMLIVAGIRILIVG